MKNKIIVFLLVFFFSFFFFYIDSDAADISKELEDLARSFPYPDGLYDYNIVFRHADRTTIVLFSSTKPLYFNDSEEQHILCSSDKSIFNYKQYNLKASSSGSSWELISYTSSFCYSEHFGTSKPIVYRSSHDIPYFSNHDSIFFRLPPETLRTVVQKMSLEEVMKEVLGILPITMVCLVGWVALRKGLAMVSLLLRKS